MKKKTVIIGASPNMNRYAFMAADLLRKYGHEFVPVGIRKGDVLGKQILDIQSMPSMEGVDTITLYLRSELQTAWQDYLLSLRPKRIIFNPGTENIDFENRASAAGIETIEACTLVMLRTSQF